MIGRKGNRRWNENMGDGGERYEGENRETERRKGVCLWVYVCEEAVQGFVVP